MTCSRLSAELVTAYARGDLGEVASWSVEAHLPGCAVCRSRLEPELDRSRLERNRATMLASVVLEPSAAERLAGRCGVPQHVWRLLSVTPSLRMPWLAGVMLVLASAVGSARLASAMSGPVLTGGPARPWPAALMPFLLLAPLLPLAGVAAAFLPRLDPAADLAIAAPVSDIWLFLVRAVAVIVAALVPTMLVALALPGSGWLPLLVVLPALAVSATALALSSVVRPLTAAIGAGAAWVTAVAGPGLLGGTPGLAYGAVAQLTCLALTGAACGLLAARRHTPDLAWKR